MVLAPRSPNLSRKEWRGARCERAKAGAARASEVYRPSGTWDRLPGKLQSRARPQRLRALLDGRQLRMMIRVRRRLVSRQRMILQQLHGLGDGALELRVVSFAHQLGILRYFDVGRDAVAFHFPLTVEIGNSGARRGDGAA